MNRRAREFEPSCRSRPEDLPFAGADGAIRLVRLLLVGRVVPSRLDRAWRCLHRRIFCSSMDTWSAAANRAPPEEKESEKKKGERASGETVPEGILSGLGERKQLKK